MGECRATREVWSLRLSGNGRVCHYVGQSFYLLLLLCLPSPSVPRSPRDAAEFERSKESLNEGKKLKRKCDCLQEVRKFENKVWML